MPHLPSIVRRRALPFGLAALALVLAFAQRHGVTYLDTRIELTEGPGRFLRQAASVWSATTDLGHVQSGQFVGYLFPQGPWFAATDLLGLPQWFGERLWLAVWLFIAGLGAASLLRTLLPNATAGPRLLAGVLFMANPYVVVQGNRATASLLAYAVLPWLLIAAHRGLRTPRGWRWPAVMALCVAAASGGTNAATVFWVGLAPAALVLYDVVVLGQRRADAFAFAWRAILLTAAASLWWVLPVLLQGSIAPDLLIFTEQPAAIWKTTSMSEALRLMGYWISYFRTGFDESEAITEAVGPYLTNPAVILATFLVPLWTFASLHLARRWRYAPFVALLGIAGLFAMTFGYPPTRPAGRALLDVYYGLPQVQVLRTTYKAGPLMAVAVALLSAAGLDAVLRRRAARATSQPLARALRWAPLVAVPIVVLAALPLFTGRLIDPQYAYGEVPTAWRTAMHDADRAAAPGRRIMVLPGQLFSAFSWGRTFTPLAPILTDRPVLRRAVSRYADPRAAQLQDAVDDAIQQRRLVEGQLQPLLALLGVGQVVVATDGDPGQSGEAPPTAIAEALAGQQGFERPAQRYGAVRRSVPPKGEPGMPEAFPSLRRYDVADDAGTGMVRLHPRSGGTLLDGDAHGVVALAASGRLRPDRPLVFTPDATPPVLDAMLAGGADLAFTDTNRRRALRASEIRNNQGTTLGSTEAIPRDRPSYEPFGDAGARAQTVSDLDGIARIEAVGRPTAATPPDQRPAIAVDGRISTTWQGGEDPGPCECLEITLRRALPLRSISVHPRAFQTAANQPLGVAVDGGGFRTVKVVPQAWNAVPVGDGRRPIRRLRLRVSSPFGSFGLDEVRIPGVTIRESLRLPTTLAAATRGRDLSRNALVVELERTVVDSPWRSDRSRDPERSIVRDVTLPVGRPFAVSGWATATPHASDPALDRLVGGDPAWRYSSSGRYRGRPGFRASSAFDGRTDTVWADYYGGDARPALGWAGPRPVALRRLRLLRGPAEFAFPDRVDVIAGDETFTDLPVSAEGRVVLPRTITTREARIEVVDLKAPARSALNREVGAVAVAEVVVDGLDPSAVPAEGALRSQCGALTVRSGTATSRARVRGDIAAFDRGDPVRIEGCGPLPLAEGTNRVTSDPGVAVRADRLSLVAAAPAAAAPAAPPGRVIAAKLDRYGVPQTARLALDGPGWLVLAQGYNEAWRATCTGGAKRELGPPTPVDGYANGWLVDPSCSDVQFTFPPQRVATAAYVVSALAGVAILAILLLALLRRRPEPAPAPAPVQGPEPSYADPPDAAGRGRFVFGALLGAIVLGVLFTPRVGALIGAAGVALALWGVSARRLVGAAVACLAVVPVLYLTSTTGTFAVLGATNPTTNLPAHWVAIAAVCAWAAAATRMALALRRRLRSRSDDDGLDAGEAELGGVRLSGPVLGSPLGP